MLGEILEAIRVNNAVSNAPVSSETMKQELKHKRIKTVDAVKPPMQMAIEWLNEHPGIEGNHTLRELEALSGVSYSTMRRALKKLERS